MKIYGTEEYEKFIADNGKSFKDKNLIIVCNTKARTKTRSNYSGYSIDTEFLSDDELSEVTAMAEAANIPFDIFYDETQFMKEMLEDKTYAFADLIVYNSAQNGTGPGRKALIPAFCELLGIRHTGSDPYRLCLCRDKYTICRILAHDGVPVPESVLFRGDSVALDPNKGYIAKPLYESSSIGIGKKNKFRGGEIPYPYLRALLTDMRQPLIVQEFIDGYEIEIPLLVSERSQSCYPFQPVCLSLPGKACMGENYLDYERIYKDEYVFSSLPDFVETEAIIGAAIKVADTLGLNGLCRVDFRLREDGKYFVTDVSTNPHFISHSSVHFAYERRGADGVAIFKALLSLA